MNFKDEFEYRWKNDYSLHYDSTQDEGMKPKTNAKYAAQAAFVDGRTMSNLEKDEHISILEQQLAAKEEQIKQLAELVEEREKISINARYSSHMVDEVWEKSYIKRQLDQILKGDK